MINVTRSYLPPLEDYTKYIERIWDSRHLTNHGPLVLELESLLREFLQVKHLFFVTNGTIALQIAIKAANLKDDVITTPFSYIATTSSLLWENCNPVFADIDKDTCTIDCSSIKVHVSEKTTGILATHVYGNPCKVDEIEALSKDLGLKVIYDAAHAFAVKFRGKSIFQYGDISTISFHATKLFHTIEGGAIVTNNDDLAMKISYMRNFGHEGPEHFQGVGINGKSSEFQAAMGLCNFPHIDEIIKERKQISECYDIELAGIPLRKPLLQEGTDSYNYSYYPVIFNSEQDLLKVKERLVNSGINPRRYFYPSLNTLNFVENNLINDHSTDIAARVLCLPLFNGLSTEDVRFIANIIKVALC